MKKGKIYALRRHDGLVKIGFTSNFDRRISALTKSHGPLDVVRIINGDRKREKRIHSDLARFNEFGEWFRGVPELIAAVMSLPEGETAQIQTTEIEREWILGEAEMAAEASMLVDRLMVARRQRTGLKNNSALAALAEDHGLRLWTIRNLQTKRSSSVSAFTIKKLRAALVAELEAFRDEMLQKITEIEGDGVSSEMEDARATRKARR